MQETRLYNPDRDETFSMRSKEDAHNYRYFPEPDLVPLRIGEKWFVEFLDEIQAFGGKGAGVVGVSPDKPAAQAKFKQKFDLPFTLLADQDKTAAEAYGVYKEKNMYGKKVMGIEPRTPQNDAPYRIPRLRIRRYR